MIATLQLPCLKDPALSPWMRYASITGRPDFSYTGHAADLTRLRGLPVSSRIC